MHLLRKLRKFVWRLLRNLISINSLTRQFLFSKNKVAEQFGRGDAAYSWKVFLHHFEPLKRNQFKLPERLLEIGPGRNLGTALLWWAYLHSRTGNKTSITCWDVYSNTSTDIKNYWSDLAQQLLQYSQKQETRSIIEEEICKELLKLSEKKLIPTIHYLVCPISQLILNSNNEEDKFDLVYSHAAIEHVWDIEYFWDQLASLSKTNGWLSHRIDLADHGNRHGNYIEMLEWSNISYWLMMRFIPGAINRWRASQHLDKIKKTGFKIIETRREVRDKLPIPNKYINKNFRHMNDEDLRTTAVDTIAIRSAYE